MPKIFISYRRKDSAPFVGRIYERLARELGEKNIFYDIEDIPKGKNFKDILRENVASCDVLLAMIGPQWSSIMDASGSKRLFNEDDYVRYEVDTALRLPKVTVIPVLINDAEMPSKADLPSVLHSLTELNAIKVRNDPDFRRDMDDLVKAIKSSRSRLPIGLALVAVLIIAIIGMLVVAPRLLQTAGVPTSTPLPTTIAPSLTDQLTATFTPPTEPTLTLLPSSVTLSPTTEPTLSSSPTDAPTPIPPSPLPPVSISIPTVVLPNTTILVTAWQNVHCIFTPDDGSIPFGFDTSTGNIQYSVKHKAGTTVSVVCEDTLGRHADNQFQVSAAFIPIETSTVDVTNTLPLSSTSSFTPTITTKKNLCDAVIVSKGNATVINVIRSEPSVNAPTQQSIAVGQSVLIRQKTSDRNQNIWYELLSLENKVLGWIPSEYISLSTTCQP